MKKFYVFLPCVALTLALLTGCGQAQAPAAADNQSETQAETQTTPTQPAETATAENQEQEVVDMETDVVSGQTLEAAPAELVCTSNPQDGLVEDAFGPAASLSGLHTGLHLLLRLRGKNIPPDTALAAAARQAGIRLSALSSYYMDGPSACPPGTLVLGYGALDDALCAPLAAALSDTLKKACTAASASSSSV